MKSALRRKVNALSHTASGRHRATQVGVIVSRMSLLFHAVEGKGIIGFFVTVCYAC
jgi:hypothetical protein